MKRIRPPMTFEHWPGRQGADPDEHSPIRTRNGCGRVHFHPTPSKTCRTSEAGYDVDVSPSARVRAHDGRRHRRSGERRPPVCDARSGSLPATGPTPAPPCHRCGSS